MASTSKPKEIGTLVVVVLKARNLPDKHTFSKQDPYAAVQLGPNRKQTQIDKRGGQHPIWDEDLHLKVLSADTKENRTLKVSCYAKEPKGDDLIGSGAVDITDTLVTGEFDDWVKLETDGAYRGEVYLEMTFFAAGPPPLARRASKLAPSERLWRPAQTPPKTSAQSSPYGSPGRVAAELGPSETAGRPTHLAPPRSSHSQSPTRRNEPALPPIPDEVPAALRPSTGKTDPKPIPAALRPGGPARLASQQQQHQRLSSLPGSPTQGNHQITSSAPVYGPQPMPNGYVAPSQPAYVSPLHSEILRPAPSPSPKPVHASPPQQCATLPGMPSSQPSYGPSWPGADYPSHSSMFAPSQPVYSGPHPPASPIGQPSHPPPSASSHAAYPAHWDSQATYPPAAPYVVNPTYDPPPLSSYTPGSPPTTAPAMLPVTSPDSSRLSFPEPGIAPSGYPSTHAGSYPIESEEERQRRLSTRYGSPMPLPPGVESPRPPPKQSVSHTVLKSPSPKLSAKRETRPLSTSPAPMSDVHSSPGPSRVPESYLKKEREALERRRQEEADAELARRLAAEAELEETPRRKASSQEETDEQLARRLAEMDETSRPDPPSRGETDEELARRLARELNSDVLEDARRKSRDSGHMPGGW